MSAKPTRAWQPGAALAGFAFLLHFPWEILQVPFFEGMPERPHWEGVKACLQATAGDVGLTLLGYEVVALSGGRRWLLGETPKPLAAMVLFLVATTVVLEWLSVDIWRRWDYTRSMPTLPLTGTGLAPLLQCLLLPPLAIWLARRHLGGRIAAIRPSDRVP